MACCFLAAFFISKLIRASELLHINIEIQYNDSLQDASSTKDLTTGSTEYISTRLRISGMTCAACVGTVEKTLSELEGVARVGVSMPLERATVVHDPSKVPATKLIEKLKGVGYGTKYEEKWTTKQPTESLSHDKDLQSLRSAFTGSMLLSAFLVMIEIDPMASWSSTTSCQPSAWIRQILSLTIASVVQTYHVVWIHKSAWHHALNMRVNMNTLICLSSILGLGLSVFNIVLQGPCEAETHFLTSSTISMVVSGGKCLELLLRRQSVNSFSALYRLQSETATVTMCSNQVSDLRYD